ncbi:hypothetical protein OG863_05965 [Streptomyces decoyicus]|uniref:Uncharacterized protein n=1 Tax=Streptomyces decoyicus TaxID=249567 RepID=A0ABZ1FBJ6_9ACTN|nr:hypothetical protein [Streptomyces decoyicus]WSB67551.1 hypothetical protein OG863_05965 [Streptomyces decoyicus]
MPDASEAGAGVHGPVWAPVLALDHIDAISGLLPPLPGNAMR